MSAAYISDRILYYVICELITDQIESDSIIFNLFTEIPSKDGLRMAPTRTNRTDPQIL